MVDLALTIFHKEEIPSRVELKQGLIEQARIFAKDPITYIKLGKQRELIAKGIYETSTGEIIPTKKEICHTAFSEVCKSEAAKDLVVNAGGLGGSILGSSFGLPGQLAGDLMGAITTRKIINDINATREAHQKISAEVKYQESNLLSKLGQLFSKAREILKSDEAREKDRQNGLADTAGWVIGNSVAEGINNTIPMMLAGIPLKGAAIALPTVPAVVESVQRIQAGESVKSVVPEIVSRYSINAGNKREENARKAAKHIIKEAKLMKINSIA